MVSLDTVSGSVDKLVVQRKVFLEKAFAKTTRELECKALRALALMPIGFVKGDSASFSWSWHVVVELCAMLDDMCRYVRHQVISYNHFARGFWQLVFAWRTAAKDHKSSTHRDPSRSSSVEAAMSLASALVRGWSS